MTSQKASIWTPTRITFRGSLEEGQGSAAPGVGQMGNPDAGLVKEVLSAARLGCQSSSLLRTLTASLTVLLQGDTFRWEGRFNKHRQHVAGIGLPVVSERGMPGRRPYARYGRVAGGRGLACGL